MLTWKAVAWDNASPYIHAASYLTAASSKLKPVLGRNNPIYIIEFGDGKWRFSWRLSSRLAARWDASAKVYVGIGLLALRKLRDRRFFRRVYEQQKATCATVLAESEKLKRSDLSKFSNQKLARAYERLLDHWDAMNVWGDVANVVDFEHFTLTNRIMAFLNKQVEATGSKRTAGEVFGTLAAPIERSYVQQQEMDFYALLAAIQRDGWARRLFRNTTPQILKGLARLPRIARLTRLHTAKYDWLQYHYDGPTILEQEYFVDLLRSGLKQGTDGQQKAREILAHERELVKQQRQIASELGLSREQRHWLDVARTFSFLKGLRKDTVFQASRNTDGLISEIGRRIACTPKQVRHMLPAEVRRALVTGEVDIDLINERVRHCVIFGTPRGLKILTGKAADRYGKRIVEEKVEKDVKELRGTPAYSGIVRGVVKLIATAEDMGKMEKGDVLISPATNPNLVPAMKKAAAIVTDEGGVTCHAAIVSRELKIPCVIGTKIATRVLKDGDRVEVDAYKGVVRKV